ncbi:MAG: Eco57I restriction-modification methylase domain-containing protein [Flavobacteriales bacterium]|nr:Eco57I restriction-modification methylase domain-containing protein [Flavobacteriales bacterium]
MTVASEQLTLLDQSALLELVPALPLMEEGENHGAVFTKEWIVDLMLDLCDYRSQRDLVAIKLLEPSCGDGAFLLRIVKRLSCSLRTHGRELSDAHDAIRAYDLQLTNVRTTRERLIDLLIDEGWSGVETVVAHWIRHADYLRAADGADFDLVIGNPPYIRAQEIPEQRRNTYLGLWSTMTMGTDIFVGFIEKGLRSLKPEVRLCFIVADRWQHNAYGRKLRKLISERYAVDAMFEMHGVDAFAAPVSAYPAITLIRRGTQGSVLYASAQADLNEQGGDRLKAWFEQSEPNATHDAMFSACVLPDWFRTEEIWPSGSPEVLAFLEDMVERFHPLEDAATGTKVGIGIATGADDVFITNDAACVEPDRLIPLLTSADITTGHVQWTGNYLVDPWDENGQLVDLTRYPRLSAYFLDNAGALKKRHVAQKRPERWYSTIDKVHSGLRERPKLVLQDMSSTISPVLDTQHYPHHNLYWITSTGWDLEVLGGLLLSEVAELFVRAYGVKMRNGTMRFQSQYLRMIRLPAQSSLDEALCNALRTAFRERDREGATRAAMQASGLTALPNYRGQ